MLCLVERFREGFRKEKRKGKRKEKNVKLSEILIY